MDMPGGRAELRILLLEDEPTDAELAEDALREAGLSFTAKRVDTRETFIRALEEFKPDIVLADYKLPSFDGGSAVKIARQQYPTVPVIMLTGAMGDEKAVELLGLGAMDYILKDRLARLGPAVQRALSAEHGIRARKAAEKALRQSEAGLRTLVEHSPIAMLVDTGVETDEKIIMMNQQFTKLFGYTMEDVPDVRHWWPLAYPDEKYREAIKADWTRRIEKAIQSHVDIEPMEVTVTCKKGLRRYVRVSLASIGNRNIITFEDLTERKRDEEKIRESEAKFRAVVETTSDWLWETNEQGVYSYASPRIRDLLGYPPEEVTGKTPFDLMSTEEAARVSTVFNSILSERKAFQLLENTCLHKDGHAVIVETSGVPVFDDNGIFRGYRGIDRDITERKQTEAALARNARDLGERVKEIKCLYDITNLLLNKELNMGQILNACTQRIPAALLDPPHTCARIRLGEQTFETANCRETEWKLAAPIHVPGMEPGLIEVFYLGEVAGDSKSPFLAEEQDLVHAISAQIAQSLERRQAEARIRKLTRLYATLSQTNETIVRTTNREELFCRICENAVIYGKFAMAWIGLVDEATHMIKPACHYGAEEGYLAGIVISTDDVPEGRGPTGTAIRENRVSYINNFTTDERAWPWREAALKHGFHGVAGLPLRFGNKVIGALTLYTDESDFFDTEQLNLLEEMATDISFAMEGFEREVLRQQAEKERGTALKKLRGALEDSIRVAASISEVRDPYTAGHQQRVSQLAVAIAREMGLSDAQVEGIRFGSLIHDIGKIGVPAEILSKPSNLTPLEMQLIKIHPQAGYDIVKEIEFPWPVAQMILQHHERLDGSGYPAGLKGDDILQEARVIAVADTVEAMSSHRPYRPSLGMDAALSEITGASGMRYDKQAVEACIRRIREKGFIFNPN